MHSRGIKLSCHPFAYLRVAKPHRHPRSLQLSEIQKPQATQVGDVPPSAKSVCAFSPEGCPQKGDPAPFSQRQQPRTHVQVCTGTGVSLGTAEGRSLIAGGGCPGFSGPAVRQDLRRVASEVGAQSGASGARKDPCSQPQGPFKAASPRGRLSSPPPHPPPHPPGSLRC